MKKQAAARFQSVWDAIEDRPEEAASMRLRSRLLLTIQERIREDGMTQSQIARLLGVTQPRVSDLVRGRIELFSVEALVDMLIQLGMRVEVRVRQTA
ncbi:MAG: helix-turn-helix domain-containing protein [Burkholderiales bacterium]